MGRKGGCWTWILLAEIIELFSCEECGTSKQGKHDPEVHSEITRATFSVSRETITLFSQARHPLPEVLGAGIPGDAQGHDPYPAEVQGQDLHPSGSGGQSLKPDRIFLRC